MDLVWTTEAPSEPGWYWHQMNVGRVGSHYGEFRIMYVIGDGRIIGGGGHATPMPKRGNLGRWAGPIPTPREPE